MLGRELCNASQGGPVGFGLWRAGQPVAELHLGAELARSRPVDRPVDDDPVEPRRERAAAVEAIEVADGSEEGFLRNVLRGGGVAGDEMRGPIRSRPVLAKETLEVGDRPALGSPDPGAFRHPPTLRRKVLTRSIRAGDLIESLVRIDTMKRLALVLVLAAAVALPGAARAAACSPLTCAASQFTLGHGSLLGFRTSVDRPVTVIDLKTGKAKWVLPDGIVGADTLVHQDGDSFDWYDATRGSKLYSVALSGTGYTLAGVSQQGTVAVGHRVRQGRTDFLLVSRANQRTISVDGKQWEFDALRGDNIFLIHYLATGGYQVVRAHVRSGLVDTEPLKDPHESGTIWGSPFSRLSSQDGRYLFTLYIGQNGGAMIHELDLKAATARCIDLPGTGDFGSATSWALTLSRGERTLWAVSPGYGRVVAIDVKTRTVARAFRLSLPYWRLGTGTAAALAPDGRRVALADGQTVAVVDLQARHIVRRDTERALALGYSPTGRLWRLV